MSTHVTEGHDATLGITVPFTGSEALFMGKVLDCILEYIGLLHRNFHCSQSSTVAYLVKLNRNTLYVLAVTRASLRELRRLVREREVLISKRADAVRCAAILALRTRVEDKQHAHYPPPHTITAFPPLAQLINDPFDIPLAPEDPRLHSALSLPDARTFIAAWCAETQAGLAALLPAADAAVDPPQALERATSVFLARSKGRRMPEGTDMVPSSGAPRRVPWVARGALGSSCALAVQLEMDPLYATSTQMDAADVFHDNERNSASAVLHHTPLWRCLTPLATEDVRRREGEDDSFLLHMWACTARNDYVSGFAQHTHVVEHVRTRYETKSKPLNGRNFRDDEVGTKKDIICANVQLSGIDACAMCTLATWREITRRKRVEVHVTLCDESATFGFASSSTCSLRSWVDIGKVLKRRQCWVTATRAEVEWCIGATSVFANGAGTALKQGQ
ncbi:hypothetical protein GGX14DRAFT_638730 [Mycena pura]|uniref:Uncharacterized protein n=1 Tax=Mycena pura TaxID=153505 RepID=A0AAD7E2Q4_9AGAR|nr:hypothetical protein GGX14DRAFT_638730 [Mycena pura]